MTEAHQIIQMVYAAKDDNAAADRLIEQYLPFIKAETAKFTKRIPQEGKDDELSIAMFAFYEAVMSFEKHKGAFLPYAARGIRNRLIDYSRKEQRHSNVISLHASDEEDGRSLMDSIHDDHNEIEEQVERTAAQSEIRHFVSELSAFGISLTDVADNCPKQERTLSACHRVLAYAKEDPNIFNQLTESQKLPIRLLAEEAKVEKKTLERHRKYIIAILLAYTNGFEIIRGHIRQTNPQKGGQLV